MPLKRKKICLVVTVESAVLCFLLAQLRELVHHYDVTVLVNTNHPDFLADRGINAKVVPFRIERKIHPWRDITALFSLIHLFRRERFDLVQSLMPKAGLLAMLAGWITGIPLRSHIFTGQVWATRTGAVRTFLKAMDRLMVFAATHLLSDSPSQRDFLVSQGIVSSGSISVLDKGSMCGVDLSRFHPNPAARREVRDRYAIRQDDVVFLFVGRLNRDKGVLDLARAFNALCGEMHNVHLLMVGPEEEQDIGRRIREICNENQAYIHLTGFTEHPENYMAASDIFCLPSYRESFGDVVMEAAAVGIPSIGSSIYGITDTITEGNNGLLHEAGDVSVLTDCMRKLAGNAEFRKHMGMRARTRAIRDFSSEQVTQAWLDYYDELL